METLGNNTNCNCMPSMPPMPLPYPPTNCMPSPYPMPGPMPGPYPMPMPMPEPYPMPMPGPYPMPGPMPMPIEECNEEVLEHLEKMYCMHMYMASMNETEAYRHKMMYCNCKHRMNHED